MELRENLFLTHVADESSHLLEWGLIAASFVSKTVGNITFLPDLLISDRLRDSSLANGKIRESKRYPVARKLGWTLIVPDFIVEFAKDGKIPKNPLDATIFLFDQVGSPTRRVFVDLCTYGDQYFVGPGGQLGYGGVSKAVHLLLKKHVYDPLKIKMNSYDNRTVDQQMFELFTAIAFAQYIVWANGDAHTYENLLQCYLLANGYASDYVIKVTSWRDVVMPRADTRKYKTMSSTQLSKNFMWHEVFRAGSMLDTNEMPPQSVINNMNKTVSVVQLLRDWHGKPIRINSGWRSQSVNKSVGGSNTSAHVIGGALDCSFSGVNKSRTAQKNLAFAVAKYLKSINVEWDQIIYYNTFIHVGVVRPNGAKARREVFETNKYASTVKRF